jgi:GTP-binding protein
MFVDKARICIKAGDGGDGCVSFHREKFVPDGGPDGGDGGRGGDLCFVADEGMRTLMGFTHRRHYRAENGAPGRGSNSSGKSAQPLVIPVPVGTVVYDEQTGAVMANLIVAGEVKKVLSGGRGGRGNARFATPTRRAPRFAQSGERKAERWVALELKSVADIGLVGYPNVGKSTLLAAVTRAQPKIADYHFTTLAPNLGVMSVDGRSYTVADIPGLIEGASEGTGLGLEFLRHIERTRVLIHIVDISGFEGRDPVEDFQTIMRELAAYSPALAARPMIVAANKTDLDADGELFARFAQAMEGQGVKAFAISAATHKGLTPLMRGAADLVDSLPPVQIEAEVFDETQLVERKEFTVSRVGEGVFEVVGDLVEDILRRIYPQDRDSMRYFADQLERHGIIAGLRERGVQDGDTVLLGGVEFDFVE